MGKRYASSQALFAFGPHQTNFQTVVAPSTTPKNWRQLVKDGYDFAAFESGSANNAGESTGFALPDEIYSTRDQTTASAVEQLTYQLLGIRAFDAFGVVVTEVLSVGAVFKHTFTLFDPFVSPTLPSRPLAVKGGGEPAVTANQIYDTLMPGMTYSRFSLSADSGNEKPNLLLSSDWQGSGQNTEPSGVIFTGASRQVWLRGDISAPHKTNINKLGGVVTFYAQENLAGTAIATECIVRNFGMTLNENLNLEGAYGICGKFQDNDPLKGSIADNLDSTGQTVDAELTMDADSQFLIDFGLSNRIKTKTPFSMKVVYEGPTIATTFKHSATLKFNKSVIANHGFPTVAGGKRGLSLTLGQLGAGNSQPVSLELITNVADFSVYQGA